jgi:hypothetical protein
MAGKFSGERWVMLAAALGIWLALAPSGMARAQTTGLEQLGRWYLAEIGWRSRGTLPADNEIASPLIAQYNWAYGAIVMGLNVRARGTNSYYATIALNDNALLDSLDSVGPLNGTALWDAGKYHLAAGLPNGQLVVWLTVPGASPQRVILSSNYAPGTGFDLAVYPPEPLTAKWEDWVITAAYQYNQDTPGLQAESFNGRGESRDYTTTLPTPGSLVSVQYADYPRDGGWTPYVVFTCLRDKQAVSGNNAHTSVQAAWYDSAQGNWIPANFRNTGLYLGNCYLGWKNGSAFALTAFDESDQFSIYGGLQLLTSSINRHGQVATSANSSCWLPTAPVAANFSYLDSARVASPFTVLSDGLDVFLGWRVKPAKGGDGVEYYNLKLFQGERVQQNNVDVAKYPVQGVAAAAHWSTGDPSLYWVQRGSANGISGGVLYQLVYWAGP